MDYFPHDTDAVNDEKIDAMRTLYGNDGYAFYFILLERIYKKNGVLDVQNPAIMAAIQRNITGDSELFEKMLNSAFELGLFDKRTFDEKHILASPSIERRTSSVNGERARKRAYSEGKKIIDVQNTGKTPETLPKEKKSKVNNNTPIIPNGIDARFQQFWNAYPNKVGKGAAEKAFKKIKPAVTNKLLADMLTAISVQRQSERWQRDGGQYIPNPSTWLNQRRWEDEPTQGQTLNSDNGWGDIPEL